MLGRKIDVSFVLAALMRWFGYSGQRVPRVAIAYSTGEIAQSPSACTLPRPDGGFVSEIICRPSMARLGSPHAHSYSVTA